MCNKNTSEPATVPDSSNLADHQAALFSLGDVVVPAGAIALLTSNAMPYAVLLAKHGCGNWGEAVSPEDAQANADAVSNGGRIFSAFLLPDGGTIWIMTEAGRSFTIILLPTDFL